jgi:hypothetical protein
MIWVNCVSNTPIGGDLPVQLRDDESILENIFLQMNHDQERFYDKTDVVRNL